MMAALAASIITLHSGFYNVMLPRISLLYQMKDKSLQKSIGFTVIYIVLLVPFVFVGIFNADIIFKIWTGSKEMDVWVIDVFKLLLLGNLFVPILSFIYANNLQMACLHLKKKYLFYLFL